MKKIQYKITAEGRKYNTKQLQKEENTIQNSCRKKKIQYKIAAEGRRFNTKQLQKEEDTI